MQQLAAQLLMENFCASRCQHVVCKLRVPAWCLDTHDTHGLFSRQLLLITVLQTSPALQLCPCLISCLQKRLAAEFSQAMAGSIEELEGDMRSGSTAQKDLAKQRRLQLREVLKTVTDSSTSSEERLRFLQASVTWLACV